MVNSINMNVSEIPVQNTITSADIKNGYTIGMKNIYPDDKTPVYEMERFPLTAYISDIDLDATKHLIKRIRNIKTDVEDQKEKLSNLVSKVKTITLTDVSAAKLQPLNGTIEYDSITSQLSSKFASPDELQNAVNNVYTALFSAVEEMMVQVFTTSMYARQYVSINDDLTYTPPTTNISENYTTED